MKPHLKQYSRRCPEPDQIPYAAAAALGITAQTLLGMLAWAALRIGGIL